MSSSLSPGYIDPANIVMLRDVLKSAGFRGVASDASSHAKRAASLFVNSEFRNGNRSRATLLQALDRHCKRRSNERHADRFQKVGLAMVPTRRTAIDDPILSEPST